MPSGNALPVRTPYVALSKAILSDTLTRQECEPLADQIGSYFIHYSNRSLTGHIAMAFWRPFAVSNIPQLITSSAAAGWNGFVFHEFLLPAEGTFEGEHNAVRISCPRAPMQLRIGHHRRPFETIRHPTMYLPGQAIQGTWRGRQKVLHLYLSPDAIERMLHRPFANHILKGIDVNDGVISHLLNCLRIDSYSDHPAGPILGETIVVALLNHLLADTASPSSGREDAPALDDRRRIRLDDWIEANISKKISLEELAQHSGFSVRQLNRTFQSTKGCSPYRYVLTRRVEKARSLIQTTSLSFEEIADMVGFAHAAHMTATFRAVLGESPSYFSNTSR